MADPRDPLIEPAIGRSPATPAAASRRERATGGWSLIELMVVLVIIGLLAGFVGPRLLSYLERGQAQAAEAQVQMLRGALLTYRLDIGRFPSTEQGLNALMVAPADVAAYWKGPYLGDAVPLDPWRNPYQYEYPADTLQGFALYSLGADGIKGGEGENADIGLLPSGSSALAGTSGILDS